MACVSILEQRSDVIPACTRWLNLTYKNSENGDFSESGILKHPSLCLKLDLGQLGVSLYTKANKKELI